MANSEVGEKKRWELTSSGILLVIHTEEAGK